MDRQTWRVWLDRGGEGAVHEHGLSTSMLLDISMGGIRTAEFREEVYYKMK